MLGGSILNVAQSRALMDLSNSVVHLENGTFLQSSRDKWATPVKGQGWKGFWIPFKDQVDKKQLKKDLAKKYSVEDVGSECDIVMFAIHGKFCYCFSQSLSLSLTHTLWKALPMTLTVKEDNNNNKQQLRAIEGSLNVNQSYSPTKCSFLGLILFYLL
jgi:hypothetical protein